MHVCVRVWLDETGSPGGQRLDPLELELESVMGYLTWVLCEPGLSSGAKFPAPPHFLHVKH